MTPIGERATPSRSTYSVRELNEGKNESIVFDFIEEIKRHKKSEVKECINCKAHLSINFDRGSVPEDQDDWFAINRTSILCRGTERGDYDTNPVCGSANKQVVFHNFRAVETEIGINQEKNVEVPDWCPIQEIIQLSKASGKSIEDIIYERFKYLV